MSRVQTHLYKVVSDYSLGIGNFTILDTAVVTEADLGVNFFLDEDSLGGFRAEHSCNSLQELNPDVGGSCITEVNAAIAAHT